MNNTIYTYTEERPWGTFEQFTHNTQSTVKIINVEPQCRLSLQYHEHRDEFWRVLEGDPLITVGNSVTRAKAGDEFHIPRMTHHRIESSNEQAKVLEISLGDFDEKDIVRIEDQYGRIDK